MLLILTNVFILHFMYNLRLYSIRKCDNNINCKTFEETLRRHSMRNKSQEFGEEAMRGWWREKDFSSVLDEHVITCEMQADDIVERIYQDLFKGMQRRW